MNWEANPVAYVRRTHAMIGSQRQTRLLGVRGLDEEQLVPLNLFHQVLQKEWDGKWVAGEGETKTCFSG